MEDYEEVEVDDYPDEYDEFETDSEEGYEPEVEEDNDLIPIQLSDDEVVEVPYAELVEMYKLAKETPKKLESYKQAVEILDLYENDNLFTAINGYRKQGYTDNQILYGLNELAKQQGKAPKEPETYEEVIDQKIKPLEAKLKSYEEKEYIEKTKAANDAKFYSSMEELGWTAADITQKEMKAIIEVFQDLYPGVDAARVNLSKRQTDAIIREALGKKATKSGEPVRRLNAKGVNAPKVLPAGNTSGRRQTGEVSKGYSTHEDRLRRYKEMI